MAFFFKPWWRVRSRQILLGDKIHLFHISLSKKTIYIIIHKVIIKSWQTEEVLLSNWYYGNIFKDDTIVDSAAVMLYKKLEENGFDQIPTGSNHSTDTNMRQTVEYCSQVIDSSRLYGFLIAPWRPTLPQCMDRLKAAVWQLSEVMP